MIVIKDRSLRKDEKTWLGKCPRCKTEFEATVHDGKRGVDSEGIYVVYTCPGRNCNATIFVSLDAPGWS